ncbi:hypothetical protein WA026_011691 [Henosepilachna vigintioctopunctata]|uniref:Uncharacterized protein n=1 Tax=Henosepilachna vigintioctopunctata TaxID=420089 RepID=A0AAW1UK50_9CUCU
MKEYQNTSKFIDQSPKLLPDSCFDFKADDEFLMSFRSTDDTLSEKEYINPLKKESVLDNSMKYQSTSQMRPRRDYFENAYTEDNLIQKIDEVLYGASVRTIWTSICNLREELLRKSRFELESSKANVRFKIDATNEDDISRLNFIYVKYSLLALKSKKKIKHLIHDIREKKSDIEVQLERHIGENWLEGLELMLENVKLKAAIEFIQKEINYTDKSDCIITLNSLNNKIDKVKAELYAKMKEVEGFMESNEYLMQQLKKCQKDTALCVRRSNQFINDTVWIEGLVEKVHSKEINTFRDFPLDYNKKFCFTDGSFYMDSMRKIILDEETSSDTLYMIQSIIENPQYPPERIFIESLKKKHKFQVMSSLKTSKVKLEQKNYSLREFQDQEKYVDNICENLMSNVRSWKAYQVLNSSSRMKSNMNLWLDMPFKRFISNERKVDGKSYKYYEEKYEYLRNSK